MSGGTPQSTYQQVQNLPSPAVQNYQSSVYPSLAALSQTQRQVYGSNYTMPQYDAQGNLVAGTGAYTPNSTYNPTTGQWEGGTALTAGSNADIDTARQQIEAQHNLITPYLQSAGNDFTSAGNTDIQGAGAGNFGSAAQNFQSAAAGQSGLAGQPQFNAATGKYEQAANTNIQGQYQPYGSAATSLYGQSTQPTGLAAASQNLNAATTTADPNGIAAYMNPYNQGVTDQIATLGARNLSENILPAIGDQFISSGQYGSQRQGVLDDRALRDMQANILAQQAQVLQQGYTTAGQQAATQAGLQAQVGSTLGNLGTQQQQLLQGAASGISGVGSTGAGLTGQQANLQLQAGQGLASIGNTNVQASQADLARQLQAAQGYTGLGQAQTAAAQAQAQNKLATGAAQQGLGVAGQAASLQSSGALDAIGQQIQQQNQAAIDASKNQFTEGQNAPFANIGAATNIANAVPGNQAGTTSGTTQQPGPSTAATIAGIGTAALGANALINHAKGGAVKKKPHSRVSYGALPKRGLGMFQRAS